MSRAKRCAVWIGSVLLYATAAFAPAQAVEPAQDEALAHAYVLRYDPPPVTQR